MCMYLCLYEDIHILVYMDTTRIPICCMYVMMCKYKHVNNSEHLYIEESILRVEYMS